LDKSSTVKMNFLLMKQVILYFWDSIETNQIEKEINKKKYFKVFELAVTLTDIVG